jgi:signal transduction histidine kinase
MSLAAEIEQDESRDADRLAQEQALEYARDLRRIFGEERVRRLELERANRRLEDEARRRADFVSLLAHELRAPVTSLVGHLELLAKGNLGPLERDQQAVLEMLARKAGDLATLVAELSEYTALASEDSATRLGPLGELPAYLERALGRVRQQADDRAIELRVSVSIARAEAEVDLGLLSLIAAQLADNAVKFGRPGGWAHVSVDQTTDFLRVVVEDNGSGMSGELRERLLGDMQAGVESIAALEGGLGLGLAIVAHAARALRAQVSLDSKGTKGTRVRMIVPLQPAA